MFNYYWMNGDSARKMVEDQVRLPEVQEESWHLDFSTRDAGSEPKNSYAKPLNSQTALQQPQRLKVSHK